MEKAKINLKSSLCIILFFVLVLGCEPKPSQVVSLRLVTETHAVPLIAEISNTPELREKGLMFRKHLNASEGMLFVWPYEVQVSFWMKNTPLSLDMIFVNAKNEIITIKERAVPNSLENINSNRPFKYVLEVKAGFTKEWAIKVGDHLEFVKK